MLDPPETSQSKKPLFSEQHSYSTFSPLTALIMTGLLQAEKQRGKYFHGEKRNTKRRREVGKWVGGGKMAGTSPLDDKKD